MTKIVKFAGDVTLHKQRTLDLEHQIAALHRSQAVIEFSADGTILEANANFLTVMGYTIDEIRGRHHRIFVDPAAHQDPAYRSSGRPSAEGSSIRTSSAASARGGARSGSRAPTIRSPMTRAA